MKKIALLLSGNLFAIILLLLTSCGSGNKDSFDQAGFNPWDNNLVNRVEAYYRASLPGFSPDSSLPPRVYIDFSNGLIQAYKGNPDNSSMIEKITQKLTGGDIKWYGLGQSKIYPLEFPTTQLFNKVTDPNSYAKDIMAPIEGAIKEITSNKGDALLVTDFEEYTKDGKEQFENFAKIANIRWYNDDHSYKLS